MRTFFVGLFVLLVFVVTILSFHGSTLFASDSEIPPAGSPSTGITN